MPLLFLTSLGLDPENLSLRSQQRGPRSRWLGAKALNQGDLVQIRATFWLADHGQAPQLCQPHFPHL